jgi:hypothetical protein
MYIRISTGPKQRGGNKLELSSLTKQLGPIAQVDVKISLPLAFLEYIKEIAIRKNREADTLDQYCSEEIIRAMIAHLDNDKDIVLRNHTIPKCIAFLDKEILDHYLLD